MQFEVFHASCVLVLGPEDEAEVAAFEWFGYAPGPGDLEGRLEVVVDRVDVGCLFFGMAVEEDGGEAEVDVWRGHFRFYRGREEFLSVRSKRRSDGCNTEVNVFRRKRIPPWAGEVFYDDGQDEISAQTETVDQSG